MSCPACGGDRRHAIAPNFWECDSTIRVQDFYPANPEAGLPEMPFVRSVRCGHRYVDGPAPAADAPVCACGTFAIGRCARCGRPVCGDHSAMVEGARLCTEDVAAVKLEAGRAEAEAKAQEDERFDRLTRAFIDGAQRQNYPGAVPIHEIRRLTGLRKALASGLERSGEFRCYGWDLGFDWDNRTLYPYPAVEKRIWLLADGDLARVRPPETYRKNGIHGEYTVGIYDHHRVAATIVAPAGFPGLKNPETGRYSPFPHPYDVFVNSPDHQNLMKLVTQQLPSLAAKLGIPLPD